MRVCSPAFPGLVAIAYLVVSAPLSAQTQHYYELDYTFYMRHVSERSMDNLRALERINAGRRQVYKKIGDARITAGRASLRFTEGPRFTVTAHFFGCWRAILPAGRTFL